MNPANPVAKIETSEGTFKAEIFLDQMPLTASNFMDLAENKFYDGLHIHRIISEFMVQMGCPFSRDPMDVRKGTGGATPKTRFVLPDGTKAKRDKNGYIKDEFVTKLSNIPGTLSMANENEPNTGSSQFFVNCAYNNFLDWHSEDEEALESKHPVFGYIVEGWDVVQRISKVRVTVPDDYPIVPIKIKRVTIERRGSAAE
eukprot:Plantae.Rhodophyta-Rhodochaete_pulchella.ctg15104.p1 GENE.Plantae.Rhodophyta-Rhodochaete_pulchella.ctg15104~~Plantae.Rhodophyta-Rhodochaete_pulchella.ctg15104.p1  ORF type:complete len:200 (-),score=40.38 Plantae.Rhodophyta-Rhodochaete_pulchella.ctg15104:85-684(-)